MTLAGDGRIRLAYKANNHVPKERLYHELKEMLGSSACTSTTCSTATRT